MSTYPYPGLRPYKRDEIDIFFGREQQTDQLLEHLGNNHFLAVVGPSGCGKSSLVRTGLLAALEAGFLPSARNEWRIAEMHPGNYPFTRLTETLLKEKIFDNIITSDNLEMDIALFQPSLRRGPKSIHELLDSDGLPENTSLLLLIDQFEEIFRYYQQGDKNEAAAFVKLLLESSLHPKIYVVITMRSDFIGDCATFHGLPEKVNQGLFLTPRLLRDQLQDAIELPAGVFDYTIAPDLVNFLLNQIDSSSDQLPQLQHALMRMWQLAHQENSQQITLTHYKKIGGLGQALSIHADEAYNKLNQEQQRIAEVLFRSLSENMGGNRDTRRPVQLSVVANLAKVSWEEVAKVAEVFREEGRSFLTPALNKKLSSKTVLDISHESLIRQWKRLKEWVIEENKSAESYRRLETTALLNVAGKAELWTGLDLANILAWYEREKPNAIWAKRYGKEEGKYFDLAIEFLEKSKSKQKREKATQELVRKLKLKRSQQKMAWISGGLIISLVLAIMAIWFSVVANEAKKEAQIAKTEAQYNRSLLLTDLARRETEAGNATNGILLTLEALPKNKSDPSVSYAEEKLYEAVFNLHERRIIPHEATVYQAAFDKSGKRVVTISSDNIAYLWNLENGKMLNMLQGHKAAIIHADFSPDNQYIITVSMDNTARLWDADNAKLLHQFTGHKQGIFYAAFSPNSQQIVTVDGSGQVFLWNTATGEKTRQFIGHKNGVFHVEFNSNGKKIITASADKTARIWDVATGESIRILRGHDNSIYYAAFSPNNQYTITASFDNTARIWTTNSVFPFQKLLGHENGISYASFSPNNQFVATASWDNTARIWDVDTGLQLRTLRGHTGRIYYLNFSPDGRYIITVAADKTARLWKASDGSLLNIYRGHHNSVLHATFSADSKQIITVSMDKTARLWDINHVPIFKLYSGHKKKIVYTDFSPDGKYIVTSSDDTTARIWNTNGELVHELIGHQGGIYSAKFSPDSKQIITTSWDKTAGIWDAQTGKILHRLTAHTNIVRYAEFSSDGKYVVTASEDKTARIWEVASGKQFQVLEGHTKIVRTAVFSPDGQYILTAADDSTARLWSATDGALITELVGHTKMLRNAQFSSNGLYAITSSSDTTARIWAIPSGKTLHILAGHDKGVSYVAFSPNNLYAVTSSWDNTASLWEVSSGKLLKILRGHTKPIYQTAFSPDSQYLVTAGLDKIARLWKIPSGDSFYVLNGHNGFIYNANFSPDSKYLITGSQDKTARLWPIFANTQDLTEYADEIVPRCLTSSQRSEFFLAETNLQATISKAEQFARAGNIDNAIQTFQQAKSLATCFKIESTSRAEQIAEQASLSQQLKTQSSHAQIDIDITNEKYPISCRRNQTPNLAEQVICSNTLLWTAENKNYKLYHSLYDTADLETQQELYNELVQWLYETRNPHCEQSVKLCLQVYEERIKLLNKYVIFKM